jgi:hypothetical protein
MRCASSRLRATSNTAAGAASCDAAKIAETSDSSGSRTRMQPSLLLLPAEESFTGKMAARGRAQLVQQLLPNISLSVDARFS